MASEPNFNQFDTDKNGQLNPDEFAYGQQSQSQKIQGQRMGMRQGIGINRGRNMPRIADFDGNDDGILVNKN